MGVDAMMTPLRRPETEAERRQADACRAGDREALDRFFREHAHRVERVIARLIGPTPELEDLVQATFIEAIRSFPSYRGEASMASWVTRIAIHVAYHHLRKGVRRFVSLEVLPAEGEHRPSVPGPESELDTRRVTARLHSLLDRKWTSAATSSGLPVRPSGIFESIMLICSALNWSRIGVWMTAGATLLTQMSPLPTSSFASDFVRQMTAALLAE